MLEDNYASNSTILFRFMKITLFLLIVGILNVYAINTHSQNARVSIRYSNEPLQIILNDIESQTDYLFIVINSKVDTKKKYSINAKSEPVFTVLDNMLDRKSVV